MDFKLIVKVEVWDGQRTPGERFLSIIADLPTLRLAANDAALRHLVRQALQDAEDAVGMVELEAEEA